MWASPRYSIYIMKLLDSHFERERQDLINEIQQQKPRMVPKNHEYDYKYLIWKEDIDDKYVKLHLVRRHKSTFRVVKEHYENEDERWYYKSNLPNAMSPNKDIKNIIRKLLKGDDYKISGFDAIIKKELLDELHEAIADYFSKIQQ